MKSEINASVSVVTAIVMLVACASKGPVSSTGAAPAGAHEDTSSEYQRLVENATNPLVCRRQAVTGSRINTEVCLTQAEMKAQSEQAAELVREIQTTEAMRRQSTPDRPPMPPSAPRGTP